MSDLTTLQQGLIDECYQMYLEVLNGVDDNFDPVWGEICFGNCGVPLCYGRLRIS